MQIQLRDLQRPLKAACARMGGRYSGRLNRCQVDVSGSALQLVRSIIMRSAADEHAGPIESYPGTIDRIKRFLFTFSQESGLGRGITHRPGSCSFHHVEHSGHLSQSSVRP